MKHAVDKIISKKWRLYGAFPQRSEKRFSFIAEQQTSWRNVSHISLPGKDFLENKVVLSALRAVEFIQVHCNQVIRLAFVTIWLRYDLNFFELFYNYLTLRRKDFCLFLWFLLLV